MTIVNAIAKWHSDGEGIRKSDLRRFVALQDAEPTSAANPSLPLGVSRDTNTKLINSDSEPEE